MASKPSPTTECEEQTITPIKEAFLNSLEDIENELKKTCHTKKLGERLQELRRHVNDFFKNEERRENNMQKEIENLSKQIRKLEDDLKKEKEKNKELEKALSLAQATWAWEKHLARFVVDPSISIDPTSWRDQMDDYLNEANTETNRLVRIRNTDKKEMKEEEKREEESWRNKQWRVIKNIRRERNGMAHPSLFNLKFVELEITKMSSGKQQFLQNMMDELKMTASLMKFGRLAKYMQSLTENVRSKKWNECVMNDIISWDRKFEEIDGLQNIEHEEAKGYLEKYVGNPSMVQPYFCIVDAIKQENREHLGKMAWRIKLPKDSMEYDEALSCLKGLVAPHQERNSPKGRVILSAAIAKLHVPDFLNEDLWEVGIKLVDKFFSQTSNPRWNKK